MIPAVNSKQKQSTTYKSMERESIFGTGKEIAKAEDRAGTQRKTLQYTKLCFKYKIRATKLWRNSKPMVNR